MRFLTIIGAMLLTTVGLSLTATAADLDWSQVNQGLTGPHDGATLIHLPATKQFLLVGPGQREWKGNERKGAFVQVFDPVKNAWSDFAEGPAVKPEIHPYYQTAYDSVGNVVYCLGGGATLFEFHVADKTWVARDPVDELADLSWQSVACDSVGRRLIVVGSDKRVDNLGWMRTVVIDLTNGKWKRIAVPEGKLHEDHRQAVESIASVARLIGHIRLAWYRDPKGEGTDAERADLVQQVGRLKGAMALKRHTDQFDALAKLLTEKRLLDGLRTAKLLQRQVEESDEASYPVPCSRRNSPLVFDPKNNVCLLFGGDHEDYLLNDTWLLDLSKASWRRVSPAESPSPRAGHALQYMPGCGQIAMYEGYVASNNTDYGARPWIPLNPVQLWLYDVRSNQWSLNRTWLLPAKGEPTGPGATAHFDGYASEWYSPPALASNEADELLLVSHARDDKRGSATWRFTLDPAKSEVDSRDKLVSTANQRLYRTKLFRTEFCEVEDSPATTGLDSLPVNQWVKLPSPPRNPCYGCRGRDWGTSVWDPDREQILLWGGGHCVRSASTVTHYSPVSGRSVEGFDADEPYGANGGGGFDSSLLNRPWVSVHNYKHYAYDPTSGMMVSGRGYLYDPQQMDWQRIEKKALPYRFEWGSTVLASSPHGVVAWARKASGEDAGLWLTAKGGDWVDLEPASQLFVPWCDSHGMVYDSKRDRLLISSVGGSYGKVSNGTLMSFSFKTRALEVITPANPELGKTNCARELAYVDHADWLLIGHNVQRGDPKTGKTLTRIYDCAANRYFLLDAGPVPDGYGAGWMYDVKRKLTYSFTTGGEAWAIRIDPQAAQRIEE